MACAWRSRTSAPGARLTYKHRRRQGTFARASREAGAASAVVKSRESDKAAGCAIIHRLAHPTPRNAGAARAPESSAVTERRNKVSRRSLQDGAWAQAVPHQSAAQVGSGGVSEVLRALPDLHRRLVATALRLRTAARVPRQLAHQALCAAQRQLGSIKQGRPTLTKIKPSR